MEDGERVSIRVIRVVTTLPLFAGAALAWAFDYEIFALLCIVAGVLLAVLQWMTVRALQHNTPPEPRSSSGPLADQKRGPV